MNIAYRFRIYPTEEQKILLGKTFGCCRFLYNQMLDDKIREYEKTKKMLKNTPAMYKKEYSFLKEVDSLALANVQLHLEKAYKNFFRDPKTGFPRFKSKHHSRNSYTTNVVNGNILVESKRIRLPKLKWIAMKKHREPAEGLRLKSVTVSMEPSGKYFASLLYEGYSCENQAAGPDYSTAKILGIDYAMQGMAVFSEKIEMEEAGFFRKNEKRILDQDGVNIFVSSLADSSVMMGIRCWVPTSDYVATKWALNEEIKIRFDEEGIEIPYQKLDVCIKNEV